MSVDEAEKAGGFEGRGVRRVMIRSLNCIPQSRDQLRIVDGECRVVIFALRNYSKRVWKMGFCESREHGDRYCNN